MSRSASGTGVLARAWQAALVVLATAVVARVAWEVLAPLVPGLFVIVLLAGIIGWAVRGRSGW